MPKVKIVDLIKESRGNKIFSEYLTQRVAERLRKGEQIVLLQNRRGFSTFIQCKDCGFIERCKNCNITLTYHKVGFKLICHYCGYAKEVPLRCPNCLGSDVYYRGSGTQRVFDEINRIFPEGTTIRMDRDSTVEKGSHSKITSEFEKGMFKILLGTQMVSKGFDFSNVNLVGVISADTGLLIPDFRASERTFQLLTQVAGRAGRRKQRGEVIIQTYFPENYSIQSAVKQDFEEFYKIESEIRSQLNYPPFGRLILIGFKGEKEKDVISASSIFADILSQNKKGFRIFGPSPSVLSRIKKKFRWQILVKGNRMYSKEMRKVISDSFEIYQKRHKLRNVNVTIDVDPIKRL
jgi:primosomal protein N' (replication factor Y)